MPSATIDPYQAVRAELAALRHETAGVRGCAVAGVDGLLLLHDLAGGTAAHDIAALAASAHGVSRSCGRVLGHGGFGECTIRNEHGYLAVYPLGDAALLAVVGDEQLNIGHLHLTARRATNRLVALLAAAPAADDRW